MPATSPDVPRKSAAAVSLVEQLYRVPENGKAEIVDGKVIWIGLTGAMPSRASGRIAVSLLQYEDEAGIGRAFGDNVGFLVDLPNRGSFSPSAAWYDKAAHENSMKFISGVPIFAVEVRSEGDYGPKAERQIRQKIADYLAAGTQVVWDVDILGVDIIRAYRVGVEGIVVTFRRGDIADAEPAVPGWRFSVDMLFR